MALDAERASFLLTEYRNSVSEDAAVQSAYPQARVLKLNTNLATTAGGDALASDLLDTFKVPTRNFDVECDDPSFLSLSDFDGSPPTFSLDFPRFATSAGTRLPSSIALDYGANSMTISVRG